MLYKYYSNIAKNYFRIAAITPYMYHMAAQNGDISILDKINNTDPSILGTDICEFAASSGHLHVLEWLHQKGHTHLLTKWAGIHAARKNFLYIIEWLHMNKYELNSCTIAYAADNDNLDIIKYLCRNNYAIDWRASVYAARKGHIETLCWLLDNGAPFHEHIIMYAEYRNMNGCSDVLKFLIERKMIKEA